MRALLVIGLFFAAAVVVVIGLFWLMGATSPDQSDLDEQVRVSVLSATEERRASSVSRFGYRVDYTYTFGGRTYTSDQFVPVKRWQPGLPLNACVDPDTPERHTLHLKPEVRCGTYIGTETTAQPQQSGS